MICSLCVYVLLCQTTYQKIVIVGDETRLNETSNTHSIQQGGLDLTSLLSPSSSPWVAQHQLHKEDSPPSHVYVPSRSKPLFSFMSRTLCSPGSMFIRATHQQFLTVSLVETGEHSVPS
ncbi:hypothetical protein GGR51DRAFT_519299 [Nemania sp. FL0031]|nr:hypothetical protein GGR51DRAFT_519299 [Nemania sp. FL0031]